MPCNNNNNNIPLRNAYPKQESEVSTFVFVCFEFS